MNIDNYIDNKNYTIAFSEESKGWTSFYSFLPDNMLGINGRFYSFKNGKVFEHYVSDEHNVFYDNHYDSEIVLLINQNPSDIKILHAIMIEGNQAWDTDVKAFINDSSNISFTNIPKTVFKKKEGYYYSNMKRAVGYSQTGHPKSLYGIGIIESISGNILTLNYDSEQLSEGDYLAQNGIKSLIENINRENGVVLITVNDPSIFSVGQFVYGVKNDYIEGDHMRGYVFLLHIKNSNLNKTELYAINSEVKKSYL